MDERVRGASETDEREATVRAAARMLADALIADDPLAATQIYAALHRDRTNA